MEKLRIELLTGGYQTATITVEGTIQDDILYLLEEYFQQYGCPVATYTLQEIEEYGLTETAVPINGGEYYIEGVSHIVAQ